MSRGLRFHPVAEAELAEAAAWYSAVDPELAADFEKAVDEAINDVRSHPDRFPVVHGRTRRKLVRRFPYGVFYVATAAAVSITAVYHLKRDPAGRKNRR